ncbi:monovalent cation/H(+) antiporter subunit G [Sulfurimonas sp.]|uniref:monovalent cation/H(+) antiporter subunit G n=1 Tax=Sulfurimonas sp. TaxID=2022749 RepID=UPI0019E12648|nr:monovalent cation/H(+) antiporter subunit G [Sulfurimonas sp.]MBE0514523.1 monovalent cation/H(+) antiporter subunit G [Sulfurimonas sp.]
MDSMLIFVSNFFMLIGVLFFLIGTLGIIRFPDLYTRLHALSKVDNLGLGFLVIGLVLQARDLLVIVKLLFLWALVLFSSATISYILSSHANENGEVPLMEEE